MPTYRSGDMWRQASGSENRRMNPICVTTNNMIMNGSLIMGAGAAAVAAAIYPGVKRRWAQLIPGMLNARGWYGVVYDDFWFPDIIAVQTKTHVALPSSVDLIAYSLEKLQRLAKQYQFKTVHLPYPGIGFGALSMEAVAPLIEPLPDNFCVWTYANGR